MSTAVETGARRFSGMCLASQTSWKVLRAEPYEAAVDGANDAKATSFFR